MKRPPYKILYNNQTGRVIIHKNNTKSKHSVCNEDDEFNKKIEELYKASHLLSPDDIPIDKKEDIFFSTTPPSSVFIGRKQTSPLKLRKPSSFLPFVSTSVDSNALKSVISAPVDSNALKSVISAPVDSNALKSVISAPVDSNAMKSVISAPVDSNALKSVISAPVDSNAMKPVISAPVDSNALKSVISAPVDSKSLKSVISAPVIQKDNVVFGIKKTILTETNYLEQSTNSNDFRIGINHTHIFDCFYLFPNISEINTKKETNIIHEKKVELFVNCNDHRDVQYFPVDFIPCGISIPLRISHQPYSKIRIQRIFWNLFQTIQNRTYINNELLCVVPDTNSFIHKEISLRIHFELHSQVSQHVLKKYENQIVVYKNTKSHIHKINPSNSCLYKIPYIDIHTVNGLYEKQIEIDLLPEIVEIPCALLCIRISVPPESVEILKGTDKYEKPFYGYIPFSQCILNFDYEIY